MIYSFDVFDTLITRRVGTPRGVFVYIQRGLITDPKGLPLELCRRFVQERQVAERDARTEALERGSSAGYQVEEIDLTDIYDCLGQRHGLSASDIERLMELELAAEAELLYGVPEMLACFRALVERGERVVLISDMYLRRLDLQRLLDGIDPGLLEHAPLYLSSEIKLNKASGRLFEHVAREEGVALTEIRHIGDNTISDIIRPRALGCRVTLFDACHLTPDEAFAANEDDFGWQVSAGIFRESRLTLGSGRARLGAIHAAPLLLPFIYWVFEQARLHAYRRLHFLAGRAQVLFEIARWLDPEGVEMRYLHVPTQVDPPGMGGATDLDREPLRNSLVQEDLTMGGRVCLVDVGWGSGIQDSLHAILNARVSEPDAVDPGTVSLHGLYWGLMDQACSSIPSNRKTAFAFQSGQLQRAPSVLREIVECFTTADHGDILAYELRGAAYHPILSDAGAELQTWGVSEFRAGILSGSDRLSRWLSPAEIVALAPYTLSRLRFLVAHPTELLARELGDFPYAPNAVERRQPFAPPLSLRETVVYPFSADHRRRAMTHWFRGSLMNSEPHVRACIPIRSIRISVVLRIFHPRRLVRRLPYSTLTRLKRRLPQPVLSVCRAILRI